MSLTRPPLHTLFIITALLAASTTTGCLASQVEVLCTNIAVERCKKCTSCSTGVDDVETQDLCDTTFSTSRTVVASELLSGEDLQFYEDLPEAQQQPFIQCVEQRSNLCANQASVREDPNTELDLCIDDLVNETCDDLFQSFALDQNTTVEACGRFL